MGKSSGGVKGYKYFTSLVLMLGNRIECLLGVNFDKKGWQHPKDTGRYMQAGNYIFDLPELYGETEGGVSGVMSFYDGSTTQLPDPYYANYFPYAPAYRHQSYVVFKDFYVGNSPYLKDVMFLPKRIHVKNDGSMQWYDEKAEIGFNANDIHESEMIVMNCSIHTVLHDDNTHEDNITTTLTNWKKELVNKYVCLNSQALDVGYVFTQNSEHYKGNVKASTVITFDKKCLFKAEIIFHTDGVDAYKYTPNFESNALQAEYEYETTGNIIRHKYTFLFYKSKAEIFFLISAHKISTDLSSNRMFPFNVAVYYPDNSAININAIDINPIHKAREIITDYTAMGKPESDIYDENFRAAASRIWDEGLGISWAIQEKSCKEALQELEAHIEGGFRINRQTGLYECVLFRDDLLDLEKALHFDESNIKTVEFDTINADDAINSYNVSYYDRENLKDSTFSIDDVGLIHTVGHVNTEKLDFPYFMNRRNAEIVANWKLKQASTAAWKGSFTTGRYDARKINKYDVILLSWQSKQLVNVPIRVLNISLGDGVDNTVTIDFIEVVSYSENMNAQINSDESMNTVLEPQSNNAVVFEAPYYELVQENGQANVNLELKNNAEAGYLMTAVSKPQNNSIYALLYTDKATEDYANLEKVGYVDYCPSLTLDQDISFTDSVFSVKNATEMSLAKVGTLILLDDELLVYQSYDAVTNKLTVKRAALDTVPKPHLKDAVFYFFDEFRFIDTEQYVASEIVQAQVLTTTPSAVQERELIDVKALELNARAIRSYPPANVKINDLYYPQSTVITNDLVITWVDRNRVQQTGGAILGYFDSGVTRENGVTYSLELLNESTVIHSAHNIDVNAHTISSSLLIQNKAHTLKLWSVRDGFESYQIFEHSFFVESASLILSATVSKDKVIGSTVPTANINVDVDESLTANMQFDGSKISGKTIPNSMITIEIED